MKDNVLVVIAAIVVTIVSALLLANVVAISLGPIIGSTAELKADQRAINAKLDASRKEFKEIIERIDRRLAAIEARQNGGVIVTNPAAGGGCGGGGHAQGAPIDLNQVFDIPAGDSPVLGKKNAPVTIVAFFDFQCPFCARFYAPIKDVLNAYPDKVRFVIKNYPLPFHPNAMSAAKLALAAQLQNKYFEIVDQLLKNGGLVNDDKIKEYAQATGINANKLIADYKNKDAQWEKQISQEKALAEKVQVRGTPSFYINGHVSSARDLEAFKQDIDKVLAAKK